MPNNTNGIRRIESLIEIPQGSFTGYYWMSDQDYPEKVNGKFDAPKTINPFIIEAMLWDEINKKSIMITYTGKYQIFEYDLNILESEGKLEPEKNYMAHRLGDVKKVKFKQFWREEEDLNCENFPVLELKAQIFVGFE